MSWKWFYHFNLVVYFENSIFSLLYKLKVFFVCFFAIRNSMWKMVLIEIGLFLTFLQGTEIWFKMCGNVVHKEDHDTSYWEILTFLKHLVTVKQSWEFEEITFKRHWLSDLSLDISDTLCWSIWDISQQGCPYLTLNTEYSSIFLRLSLLVEQWNIFPHVDSLPDFWGRL